MNSLACVLTCLVGTAMGFPQLESFDKFFDQFGSGQSGQSGQFSQPTFNRPPPSRPAHTPQFQSPSSFKTDVESGKMFPTAVPYVHDPSGDGRAARRQQADTRRIEDPQTPVNTNLQPPVTNTDTDVVDPKSHQAALQRNALHRQQLAEVIAKHNQVLNEREEEIIRASAEETDDEEQDNRSLKSSFKNRRQKTQKQFPSKEKKFNLEVFLKTESREAAKKPQGLSNIQAEVVENLDLIGQLAQQIAELDIQAYDVFSKQDYNDYKKEKSSKFVKTASREEDGLDSDEDTEFEDYFAEPEQKTSKSKSNGRIRNIGLRIRQ